MAEGDGVLYNSFKVSLFKGEHNLDNGGHELKLALFTSSYTPNIDTQSSYTALTNECSGTGYTAGGKVLANQVVTVDLVNNRALVDADDVTWTSLGTLSPQPAWAVLYNNTHTSKALIAYWEIATPTNGGNWAVQFSSAPSAIVTMT